MAVETMLVTPKQAQDVRAQLVNVYRAAFSGAPHFKRELEVTRFGQVLADHIGRDGFRCCVAQEASNGVLGFAYGYPGRPGQWWYESVARAMDPVCRERWLADCFEFMEFAVLPDRQGQGIGSRIHDILIGELSNRTAVLSTPQSETAALRLYRRRGWVALLSDFVFPGDTVPFLIMGLDLAMGARVVSPDERASLEA